MTGKPVHEYGNAIRYMPATDPQTLRDSLAANMNMTLKPLEWISDLEWVDKPYLVPSPYTDKLRRWEMLGWKAKFASQGYEDLRKHFACRRPHRPEFITIEYITEIIHAYAEQNNDGEDDDDY